ncbi:hypothetical protein QJS04_geneDACA013822 [Acorus gramineus]|uniref:Uncharacterized protein n=1 Tax=Acorus gramineus TaxID=55184 RepID=A0AAV9AU19_ACOGR|nr:hypothetical protein QJS04_geneDACA013822 [Acorus gramineus]
MFGTVLHQIRRRLLMGAPARDNLSNAEVVSTRIQRREQNSLSIAYDPLGSAVITSYNSNVLNSSEPTRAHNYDAGNMHKVITGWNIVGERNSGGQREFPL